MERLGGWGGGCRVPRHCFPYLLGIVSCEAELSRCLAPSVFAAIEVHAPGTAKGEGGTTGVGVFALASTGPAAMDNTGQAYRCGLCCYYPCRGLVSTSLWQQGLLLPPHNSSKFPNTGYSLNTQCLVRHACPEGYTRYENLKETFFRGKLKGIGKSDGC